MPTGNANHTGIGDAKDIPFVSPRCFAIGALMVLILLSVLAALPSIALAQTDEIQVYDAEIEELGKFNVMVHSNFTPIGRKTPDFPGGIIPNDSVNGAVEWAYGVAPMV